MRTGRHKVSELLNSTEIDQIIIPELQRDYVWTQKNVDRLLASILKKYKEKNAITINLKIESTEEEIPANVSNFLLEEYARLRYNTRVGFIYAYSNREYAGKYFLIDGQQRMTTIFLFLLAAYVNKGDTDGFRNKYFKNSEPKIDYKVRETAHDFLVDFIEFELTKKQPTDSFSNSSKNFYEAYANDITAQRLLDNYSFIQEKLREEQITSYETLIDYIENYIEFNYFDTNISEQGERLYIYMNSRGEGLSTQEKLRPLIVSRIEDDKKIDVGKDWEYWQDFFWNRNNRGGNYNADKGFQEFCKWATVLHMIVNEKTAILKPAVIKNSKKQTPPEVIEDYVRCENTNEKIETQTNWLREYQEQNADFNYTWLKSCFVAVEKLKSFSCHSDFIVDNWLQGITTTIHYVPLLSTIYYLIRFPNAQEIDVKRIGMYFKNICEYDTNSKNPDSTTILSIQLVKKMADNSLSDIAQLSQLSNVSDRLYSETDKKKEEFYKRPDRKKWESVFWNIVKDKQLNNFLKGDVSFLLNWKYLLGNINAVDFGIRANRLKTEVYNKRDQLYRTLLSYGDFCKSDRGGGSGNLGGNWMCRYSLIRKDDDWYYALQNESLSQIIINYLENKGKAPDALYRYFVETDKTGEAFNYMSASLFLCTNANDYYRIVILRGTQASRDKCRDIMPFWLEKMSNGYLTAYLNNVNYMDFEIQSDGSIVHGNNQDSYFLEIIYNWDQQQKVAKWSLSMAHKNQKTSKKMIPETEKLKSIVQNFSEWEETTEGRYELKDFLIDDLNDNVISRLKLLKATINKHFTTPILFF